MTTPRYGPLFAKGFRPFFLGASLVGATFVATWLAILFGGLGFSGRSPLLWHGHEMVYGFTLAVVAGFLLTAVENWTGRETATGAKLSWLFGLWGLGRLLAWGVPPGPWLVPAQFVEVTFLPVLLVVLGRPIVAARSWRNGGFLALLLGLWLCDIGYAFGPEPALALARAVDLLVIMIVIVSGRVIPMFTRNGIGDATVASWPRVNIAALLVVVATVFASAANVGGTALTALEATSALLLSARMIPWKTHRTLAHPLVWVLHMGHAWLAIGFALRALYHGAGIGLETLGLHAHTAGAIAAMTLGMMARVALGHTGRPLAAPRGIPLAFCLIGLAALARVLPGLVWLDAYRVGLLVSGLLFTAAQLLYLASYLPILLRPRLDGRPG